MNIFVKKTGWKDASMVNSPCDSCRRPGFCSVSAASISWLPMKGWWTKEKRHKQATPGWPQTLIKTQTCQESQQRNKNVCGQFRSQETPNKRSTCDKIIHQQYSALGLQWTHLQIKFLPLNFLFWPRKCWSLPWCSLGSSRDTTAFCCSRQFASMEMLSSIPTSPQSIPVWKCVRLALSWPPLVSACRWYTYIHSDTHMCIKNKS